MLIETGSKLIMTGDSVTDCDRARPVGEGLFGAIGNGYVNFVQANLIARYPEKRIRVVNMGTSGNNVRDLKARWTTDIAEKKPDWLSIMIGINDVWRQFDSPLLTENHVYLEEYAQTLDELVGSIKPSLKGLVLMTPYYIEPNAQDAMRSTMDRYGAAVKAISQKHSACYVDTQAAFNKILEHYHPNMICWDRVHPNNIGHMVIAKAFLEVIEF